MIDLFNNVWHSANCLAFVYNGKKTYFLTKLSKFMLVDVEYLIINKIKCKQKMLNYV